MGLNDVSGVVVTLPGIYNSGPTHWQSLWEESRRADFRRFAPMDWDQPQLTDWIAALDRAVATAPAPPLLVAHSLSCLLVPIWARGTGRRVRGAVLVAPVDPAADLFPEDAAEFAQFTDFVRRPLPFPTVVVGSDDDPYATAMWSRDFADGLGAAYVNAGPFGHLNADSGLGDWPWGQGLVAGFAAALP